MITLINEKYWVVEHDTHFPNWITEANRLDHDQYVLPIILSHIKDGIILDIGANIGTHTYAYCEKVGKHKVIGFEPNPECAECLRRNVPDCIVVEAALSDEDGECNMIYSDNVGASHVIDGVGIKKIKFDQHVNLFKSLVKPQKVTFIKIDIEGYEVKALNGMSQTIKKDKPIMWIEVNRGALLRAKTSEDELLSLVESLGYKYTPYPYVDIQYDILCIPI